MPWLSYWKAFTFASWWMSMTVQVGSPSLWTPIGEAALALAFKGKCCWKAACKQNFELSPSYYWLPHSNDCTSGIAGQHGYTWIFMGIHGYIWIFMGIHGYKWIFMGIHGYTWVWIYIYLTFYVLHTIDHFRYIKIQSKTEGIIPRL